MRGEYGYFLRFQITQRFNNLIIPYNPNSWSEEQQEIHDLIKSLHNGGMGYRKIAQYLNEKGIKTAIGNSWVNTQVFSVLKKYRLRQERIKNVRLKEYKMEIGKFELKWIKDTA